MGRLHCWRCIKIQDAPSKFGVVLAAAAYPQWGSYCGATSRARSSRAVGMNRVTAALGSAAAAVAATAVAVSTQKMQLGSQRRAGCIGIQFGMGIWTILWWRDRRRRQQQQEIPPKKRPGFGLQSRVGNCRLRRLGAGFQLAKVMPISQPQLFSLPDPSSSSRLVWASQL